MATFHRELNQKRVKLVLTELDLVETFLRISNTAPSAETRQRNRRHAREAYEMARRYASRLAGRRQFKLAIQERLTEVELALKAAGEELEQ